MRPTFKGYLHEGEEWVIRGVRELCKKTESPRGIISAFRDEVRGFGSEPLGAGIAEGERFYEQRDMAECK